MNNKSSKLTKVENQSSVIGHFRGNALGEKIIEIKKCAYRYCSLNEMIDGKMFGICKATNYRYERCRNRVKKWLNGESKTK